MKRRILAALLAGMMIFSLAACGKDSDDGAAKKDGAASEETITLKFWDMVWGGPEYATEAEKLAKSYSEVVPNVKIEYQSIPWANRYETFSVAVAAGDGPDVSTGGGYQQHQFAATGNILPLNDIMDEWKEEGKLEDLPQDMIKFFQDAEGNQLGIPFNFEPRGIFYRKDYFEEKGLQIPKTWDELHTAIKTLSDPANGKYGMAYPAADAAANVSFMSWLVSNGSGVWTEDGKTPDWTNEKNVKVLEFISSLRDEGCFPEGMASYEQADAQKMFLQGNSAMMVDGIGFGLQIQEQGDEFAEKVGIMPFPQGPDSSQPGMSAALNAYMVYSSTEYPEEAKAFIKWWSENNFSLWTGPAGVNASPARISFLEDEAYLNNEANPFLDDMVEQWVPAMQSTMYPAASANVAQATVDGERWWRDVSQAILMGEKTPEEILQDKQDAAEQLLKDLGIE